MPRVVVIGGGVIGLSCAYYLARRGATVTVLERATPGAACSAGNLGWVVPSLSEPLPAPGLTGQSIRYMLKRDSPLYIDPVFALTSAGWLWQFWRHCNAQDSQRGLEAIGTLNRQTFPLFDALRADGVRFEMHRDGLLFLFLSAPALERAFDEFQSLAGIGLAIPRKLARYEVLAMEPIVSRDVHGGILVEHEGHVRPETLCQGLLERLQSLGGEVRSGTEVTGIHRKGKTARSVNTAAGSVEADAFVLAGGTWSGEIARRFGFALPVQPGKGYTVTVTAPRAVPSRAIYLHEMRVGISPFNGAARLGGTMELSGFNARIRPERVAAIRRAAARYLPGSVEGRAEVEWTGMRPLTPDGLPAIGRAPGLDNVYVATGHAMLGVTLAPVTGCVMAELVTGARMSVDLKPFDPGRF